MAWMSGKCAKMSLEDSLPPHFLCSLLPSQGKQREHNYMICPLKVTFPWLFLPLYKVSLIDFNVDASCEA